MLRWDKAEVVKSISDFGMRKEKHCVGLIRLVQGSITSECRTRNRARSALFILMRAVVTSHPQKCHQPQEYNSDKN